MSTWWMWKPVRSNQDQLVAVTDGRIIRVVDDEGLDLPVYGDMQPKIIDGQGLTLVPGLWDMHTHLSFEDGLLQIAAGVTHTRDLGNDPQRLAEIRMAFDQGSVIGPVLSPRALSMARALIRRPLKAWPGTWTRHWLWFAGMLVAGLPQIKIYSVHRPGMGQAHGAGNSCQGHAPFRPHSFLYDGTTGGMDGFDEIQHINMLFLNFLAGPEDDTRTPLRFTLVAEQAGSLDLASEPVQQFIGLLKDRGVVVDPTVAIFDSMFRHRSGELDPSYAMIAEHMPPAVRRGMLAGELDITDANAARYARSADALLEMIALLHQAGIPLVAGTDAMAGFTLHRELELYHQAGISNADVLRIATLDSARVAGKAADSGSISMGKQADFVLLAGNPLQDISALRAPVAVFQGDRWFDPAQLYEAVGIRPFTR